MGAMTTEGWQVLGVTVLVAFLGAAAWIDVRQHRIPNAIVLAGLVSALLFAHLGGGSLATSLMGLGVGMALGLPLYALRAMGAGDVKLMGMVGAHLGGPDMFVAALVIFIVGGLLGIAAAARRGVLRQLGANVASMLGGAVFRGMTLGRPTVEAPATPVGVQPYGVAIALGTVLYLLATRM